MTCEVCGDESFHVPNSYICKLVMSSCKHEWGDHIETENRCVNCGHGYMASQCKKCEMHSAIHWSELLPHDEGHCIDGMDRNKCPKCKKPTAMARPKAHHLGMVCEHCKYEYTDQEAEKVLGVKKVDTVDLDGQSITAFVNTGNGHEFYHSWYCLKRFKTYDQMKKHDTTYHKIGDPMAGCIPSGYIVDVEVRCGMDGVIPC
jgi:hypothetical protein